MPAVVQVGFVTTPCLITDHDVDWVEILILARDRTFKEQGAVAVVDLIIGVTVEVLGVDDLLTAETVACLNRHFFRIDN